MSNAIEFLERLGQDATLRYAPPSEIEQALTHAGMDPVLRAAILGNDRYLLEQILGAKTIVCCSIISPAEEEEKKRQRQPEEEKPAKQPAEPIEKPVKQQKSELRVLERAA